MTGIKIGRIFGIEVRLDFSWFIIFVFFSWTLAVYYFPRHYPHWSVQLNWAMGILASLLLFVSVILHELSHSLVAKKQGEEVRSITLFILGGVAQIAREPPTPHAEFTIAIAGPLASFFLGLLFLGLWWLIRPFSEPLAALTKYLAVINFILGGFNLLPGYPMDGGRVLKAILWKVTGSLRRATHIATKVGQFIASFFIFFGLFQILAGLWLNGLWIMFIGWFLYQASLKSYQQVLFKDLLQGIKARDLMTRDFITVTPDTRLKILVEDYILKKGQRAFIVTDNREIVGIICLEDVKKVSPENWADIPVSNIMTPKARLEMVLPEDDAAIVLQRLTTRDIHQVPVVEDNQVVGVITRNDLLRWMQVRMEWEK
ncbi:MAG: site-2 protease family protein [Candidatus Desulfofervidaceae bacterium]|nr:site-2 protease family protein [Candidatus Desulfofervidaceae bacterium]